MNKLDTRTDDALEHIKRNGNLLFWRGTSAEAKIMFEKLQREGRIVLNKWSGRWVPTEREPESVMREKECFGCGIDSFCCKYRHVKSGAENCAHPATNNEISASTGENMRHDWVIEINAIGCPCYLSWTIEGDPGRTHDIARAERFATENEARENLEATRRMYPHRKYKICPLVTPT